MTWCTRQLAGGSLSSIGSHCTPTASESQWIASADFSAYTRRRSGSPRSWETADQVLVKRFDLFADPLCLLEACPRRANCATGKENIARRACHLFEDSDLSPQIRRLDGAGQTSTTRPDNDDIVFFLGIWMLVHITKKSPPCRAPRTEGYRARPPG